VRTKFVPIIALCVLFCANEVSFASSFLFYKELNLLGGYSYKRGFAGQTSALSNSAGFEHYGKFSSKYGDYLTTDLQVRFAYYNSQTFREAWAFEIHNAWVKYNLASEAKIKVGHFAPAFGLEPMLDTHGTILQTLAMRDIGFKKDWGLGLEGSLPGFDYKAAIQLGSGMSIRRLDGSFLVTARIGAPAAHNFEYGISGLYGEVLKTRGMSTFPKNHLIANKAVAKKRLGLDVRYLWSSFFLKGEFAYGANDDKNALGYLLEADYTAPKSQNWQAKAQFQSWINDMGKAKTDDSTLTACVSYNLNQKITLRAAYIYDLNMVDAPKESKIVFQFYYYGT